MADNANATAVNGNAVFGLRALATNIVSTLLNSCTVLAALAIFSSNKADAIQNVGTPDAPALITGANLTPAQQREINECQEKLKFVGEKINELRAAQEYAPASGSNG